MTRRCCLLALVAVVVSGAPAFGQQDGKVPAIPFDGPEVFCYLLHSRKFAPVKELAALLETPPGETLLIVFGRQEPFDRAIALSWGLQNFHDKGGAVLFASDRPGTVRGWGLAIAPDTLIQDKRLAYRENRECPLIPALEPGKPAEFHALARGVAMNRPSYFLHPAGMRDPALHALANVPESCFGLLGLDGEERPFMLFADGKQAAGGRTLLISGNGLFTNTTLLQLDNDNFEFATSCLRWLGEGPGGARRRHALFIVDGKVVENFDVPLKAPVPPLPPIPTPTLELVNRLMHGLEREDFFVNLLRDNVDIQVPIRLTLILLTVSLLVYGAKKLSDQRFHAEAGSALLVGAYAPPSVPSALVQQRFTAQVERDGLWEEARALARQWCFERAGIPVGDWHRVPVAQPDFKIVGGWWESLRLRRQANRLFQLAGERTHATFSWRELVRLTGAIQSLNQAAREGRLCVSGCSALEKP